MNRWCAVMAALIVIVASFVVVAPTTALAESAGSGAATGTAASKQSDQSKPSPRLVFATTTVGFVVYDDGSDKLLVNALHPPSFRAGHEYTIRMDTTIHNPDIPVDGSWKLSATGTDGVEHTYCNPTVGDPQVEVTTTSDGYPMAKVTCKMLVTRTGETTIDTTYISGNADHTGSSQTSSYVFGTTTPETWTFASTTLGHADVKVTAAASGVKTEVTTTVDSRVALEGTLKLWRVRLDSDGVDSTFGAKEYLAGDDAYDSTCDTIAVDGVSSDTFTCSILQPAAPLYVYGADYIASADAQYTSDRVRAVPASSASCADLNCAYVNTNEIHATRSFENPSTHAVYGQLVDAGVKVATEVDLTPYGGDVTVGGTVDVFALDGDGNRTVTLCDDVDLVVSADPGEGTADCDIHLPAGTTKIGSQYTPTGLANGTNYVADVTGTSTMSVDVDPADTVTTLTADRTDTTAGSPVTLTAKITYPSQSTPGGDLTAVPIRVGRVTFTDTVNGNTTEITDCRTALTVADDGTATCTFVPSAGVHDFTAALADTVAYSPNLNASSDTISGFSVAKGTPTVSVTLTAPAGAPTTVAADTPVTLTAHVGPGTPGGTVDFLDAGHDIADCTAVTVASGTATCTITPTPGSHAFTVTYSGDTALNPGSSDADDAIALVVSAYPSEVTVSASPTGSAAYGTPITLTAMVHRDGGSGAQAGFTNTVTFTDGGVVITACGAQSGPSVTCTITPGPGSHTFAAHYAGSAESAAADSAPLTYQVTSAATSTSVTAANTAAGTLSLVAAVAASSGTVAPGGTVDFTVNGAAVADCQNVTLTPVTGTAGSTATCTWQGDVTASPVIGAHYDGSSGFAASDATPVTFEPPPACTGGTATLWQQIAQGGTVTLAAGAAGTITVQLAGAFQPCAPGNGLTLDATVELFGSTLTGSVTGATLTTAAGICLGGGTLHLADDWHLGGATVTTPICFDVDADASLGTITSGQLVATGAADSLAYVTVTGTPATRATVGFTGTADDPTMHVAIGAGTQSAPVAMVGLDVASDGTFTGTITTPGLALFGTPLTGLDVTVTGTPGGAVAYAGTTSLGAATLTDSLSLEAATIGLGANGFIVNGTAVAGDAATPLTLAISGSVSDPDHWQLALSGTSEWSPLSGWTLTGPWSGTVTHASGTTTATLTGAGGTWDGPDGVEVDLDSVSLGTDATGCAVGHTGNPILTVAGTLHVDRLAVAVSGCADLATGDAVVNGSTSGTEHLDAAMDLTSAEVTFEGAGGATTFTGSGTAVVHTGDGDHTLDVTVTPTPTGALVVGGQTDLTDWGLDTTDGYVAWASTAVAHSSTGVAALGAIQLTAGVGAYGSLVVSAGLAATLREAGYQVPGDRAVPFRAAISPQRSVTFVAGLATPSAFPFLGLPAGLASVTARLTSSSTGLHLDVTASVTQANATPVHAELDLTLDANGSFHGTADLDDFGVLEKSLHLTGQITGGPTSGGGFSVDSSARAHWTGTLRPDSAPNLTVRDIVATWTPDGVDLDIDFGVAGRDDLTASGTATSTRSWTLDVSAPRAKWTPYPGLTMTTALGGTLTHSSGRTTVDVSADFSGANVPGFSPADPIDIRIEHLQLSTGTPPSLCRLTSSGDAWLKLTGSAELDLLGEHVSQDYAGCLAPGTAAQPMTFTFPGWSTTFMDGNGTLTAPTVTISQDGGHTRVVIDAQLTLTTSFLPTFTARARIWYGYEQTVVGVQVHSDVVFGDGAAAVWLYYSFGAFTDFDSGEPLIGDIDLVKGLNVVVAFRLSEPIVDALHGIGADVGSVVTATGTYDQTSKTFILTVKSDLGLAGDKLFETESGVSLAFDNAFIKISVAPSDVSIALGTQMTLHVPALTDDGHASDVQLTGQISLGLTAFNISLQMGDCDNTDHGWDDAFGIDGLDIACAAIQGGVGFGAGIPKPNVGLLGNITSLPDPVADAIGYRNGSPMNFAFNLDPLLLSIEIGTKDSDDVALAPLSIIGAPDAIQVRYANLYVATEQVTIGQTTFQPGFQVAFQGSMLGVDVDVLARVDPTIPKLKFHLKTSAIDLGPLTIGPVSVDLEASKTSFSFDLDGHVGLGPGEVNLGLVKVGGELSANARMKLRLTEIEAYLNGKVAAWVAAYLPHDVCWEVFIPYPCDWDWDKTGFSVQLRDTGFSLNGDGITVKVDGYSLTLPFESVGDVISLVSTTTDDAEVTPAVGSTASGGGGALPASAGLDAAAMVRAAAAAEPTDAGPPTTLPEGIDPAHPYIKPLPDGGAVKTTVPGGKATVVPLGQDVPAAKSGRAPGSWHTVSPLAPARTRPSVIRLADGKVLVAGGTVNGTASDEASVYDPVHDSWSDVDTMHTPRVGATAVRLEDGRVLVAGGTGPDGDVLDSAELFDPLDGSWTETGSLHVARHDAPAVRLGDGRVLVTGGVDAEGQPLAETEVFDPATGDWSSTGDLATARSFAALGLLGDGTVIVAGGMGPDGLLESAERYDPARGTWRRAAPLPKPRMMDATATLRDGSVLVAGTQLASEVFDPDTGEWTPTGGLVDLQPMASAVTRADGTVLLVGGIRDKTPLKTTQVYDPSTNRWQAGPDLPEALTIPGIALLANGSVLSVGGSSGLRSTRSAAIFTPPDSPGQKLDTAGAAAARRARAALAGGGGGGVPTWLTVGGGILVVVIVAGVAVAWFRRRTA